MNFIVDSKEFNDAVQKCNAIIGKKSCIPILANIHIDARTDVNNIYLVSTDLETYIRIRVRATILEEGQTTCCLLGQKFENDGNLKVATDEFDDKKINFLSDTISMSFDTRGTDEFPMNPFEGSVEKVAEFKTCLLHNVNKKLPINTTGKDYKKCILLSEKEKFSVINGTGAIGIQSGYKELPLSEKMIPFSAEVLPKLCKVFKYNNIMLYDSTKESEFFYFLIIQDAVAMWVRKWEEDKTDTRLIELLKTTNPDYSLDFNKKNIKMLKDSQYEYATFKMGSKKRIVLELKSGLQGHELNVDDGEVATFNPIEFSLRRETVKVIYDALKNNPINYVGTASPMTIEVEEKGVDYVTTKYLFMPVIIHQVEEEQEEKYY